MLKTLEDYHEKMRRALNRANTKPDCRRRDSLRTEHGFMIRTGYGNKGSLLLLEDELLITRNGSKPITTISKELRVV